MVFITSNKISLTPISNALMILTLLMKLLMICIIADAFKIQLKIIWEESSLRALAQVCRVNDIIFGDAYNRNKGKVGIHRYWDKNVDLHNNISSFQTWYNSTIRNWTLTRHLLAHDHVLSQSTSFNWTFSNVLSWVVQAQSICLLPQSKKK